MRLLADRGHRVRLVSIGTGSSERSMRERARGAPGTFLGFIADRDRVAAILVSADAVIAPGPIETFGLATLEALASGTPVVVNAASALPEGTRQRGPRATSRGVPVVPCG